MQNIYSNIADILDSPNNECWSCFVFASVFMVHVVMVHLVFCITKGISIVSMLYQQYS